MQCLRCWSLFGLHKVTKWKILSIHISIYMLASFKLVCLCASKLFNTQAQSLLLMTSVAMPVFSKKKETVSYHHLHSAHFTSNQCVRTLYKSGFFRI